ncbi:MAG: response regulator [Parafilimonas sp.]|nr:response regulator [Parafilimonas sp.]
MTTPKILLIEDNELDFERAWKFFKQYNIEFYPKHYEEFEGFSKKLIKYSRANNERKNEFLADLSVYIKNVNPDIVLIDLGLDGKKESLDKPGLDLLQWIKINLDPETKTIIFSGHENDGTIDGIDDYIQKSGIPVETQFEKKIIQPYKIKKAGNGHVETDAEHAIEQEHQLTRLEKFANFDYKVLSPWSSVILDKVVTYVFYVLIIVLFTFAPIDIIKNSDRLDSFRIAERTFIAFLPFLIVCGFYVFYKKSLRAYFFKEVIDPRKDDFESSSVLMKLTKKLFVSSLLSYLFIKLIELFCLEKPDSTENYFLSYFGKNLNPFIQLYLIAGLIVILILYYIYIDKTHSKKSGDN